MRPLRPSLCLVVLLLAAVTGPLVWRTMAPLEAEAGATPSYLPSVEAARVRRPFDDGHLVRLAPMQPGVVIIGDSMVGRVHAEHLDGLLGTPVAPIIQLASSSGYWYLALKNWVVASGIKPRWTLIMFRDTNLTDLMFRLLDGDRWKLDEAARDLEPELDAVVARRLAGSWYQAHRLLDQAYGVEAARTRVEPALTAWPARVLAGNVGGTLLQREVNDRFALEQLRPMPISDMSVVSDNDADFHANVDASVLPLMLSLAREHGHRLVFVRTQRRAPGGGLRPESPALVKYMRDLRAYVEARGAVLIDDQHDQEILRLPYDDLDHIDPAGRIPYTEILARKLRALPQ